MVISLASHVSNYGQMKIMTFFTLLEKKQAEDFIARITFFGNKLLLNEFLSIHAERTS